MEFHEQFANKKFESHEQLRTRNIGFHKFVCVCLSLNYDILFRVKLKATVTLLCINFVAEIKENNKPCTHAHDDDKI